MPEPTQVPPTKEAMIKRAEQRNQLQERMFRLAHKLEESLETD